MYKQFSTKLKNLSDWSFIITAGPTREWIDPFRFISNPSSGKMGLALAKAASEISSTVKLIHGPIDRTLIPPHIRNTVQVESTQEMCTAVLESLSEKSVLVMAAAPADFTPGEKSDLKIKKSGELTLRLLPTPDILKTVSKYIVQKNLKNVIRVGFAAETHNTHEYAKKKLIEKELDFICLNDISKEGSGFASDTNEITLFSKKGTQRLLRMKSKEELAYDIFEALAGEVL